MYPANKIQYEIGQMIGSCFYLGEAERPNKDWRRYGYFRCECGKKFIAYIPQVKAGHTKSCGCLVARKLSEMSSTHGKTNTPEYTTWVNIKQRCRNPKYSQYKDYGGRGIEMCDRWFNSFENFLVDVGEKPSAKHSLDRHPNNDGNYEPGNTRWATTKEQALNKSNNRIISYMGIEKPLKVWTDEFNMPYHLVHKRIDRLKWSIEKALKTPKRA